MQTSFGSTGAWRFYVKADRSTQWLRKRGYLNLLKIDIGDPDISFFGAFQYKNRMNFVKSSKVNLLSSLS